MTDQEPNDAELMAHLAAGRASALGELARRHQRRVLGLAFRTLGHWDLAEDVAQETFLRVYRAAKRYQPQAKFTTWLYRIVLNLCLDERRRLTKNTASLESIAPDGPASPTTEPVERKEAAELVRAAVRKLPERQRIAIILYRYEGLSHAQISEATGWSQPAVESLLVRAYATLRRKLAKMKNFIE